MHVHHVSARRVLKPSYLKAKAIISRCFRVVESSRGTSRLLQRLSHLGAAHLYSLARSSQCWWEFLPQVCKMPWAAEMPWAHFWQGYNGTCNKLIASNVGKYVKYEKKMSAGKALEVDWRVRGRVMWGYTYIPPGFCEHFTGRLQTNSWDSWHKHHIGLTLGSWREAQSLLHWQFLGDQNLPNASTLEKCYLAPGSKVLGSTAKVIR